MVSNGGRRLKGQRMRCRRRGPAGWCGASMGACELSQRFPPDGPRLAGAQTRLALGTRTGLLTARKEHADRTGTCRVPPAVLSLNSRGVIGLVMQPTCQTYCGIAARKDQAPRESRSCGHRRFDGIRWPIGRRCPECPASRHSATHIAARKKVTPAPNRHRYDLLGHATSTISDSQPAEAAARQIRSRVVFSESPRSVAEVRPPPATA